MSNEQQTVSEEIAAYILALHDVGHEVEARFVATGVLENTADWYHDELDRGTTNAECIAVFLTHSAAAAANMCPAIRTEKELALIPKAAATLASSFEKHFTKILLMRYRLEQEEKS